MNLPLTYRKRYDRWRHQQYAQPAAFGALYRRAGSQIALALIVGLDMLLLLAMALKGSLIHPPLAGDFYPEFSA